MEDSILLSIKKQLGIADEDAGFDTDIIIAINTVFGILTQLGAGPKEGYSIGDSSEEWSDYLQDNVLLEMVKTYMYLKVKMIFDPPSGSSRSSYEDLILELESRINYTVDPGWENMEE